LSPARLQIPHALSFFTFGDVRRANGGGIEKAKVVLDEAAKLFPDDSTIQYNLACYCAQLRQRDAAKEHLGKVIRAWGCPAD